MAKIDEIKEELNYLKVWLSIIVVTNIGLASWLINNYETSTMFKTVGGMVSVVVLTLTVVFIDKVIPIPTNNQKSKLKIGY